jgi:hypothetical protein
VKEQCTIRSVVDVTTQLHKVNTMDNVNKVLADAIDNALTVFADTADRIAATQAEAATQRAVAVNFAIDCAVVEGLDKIDTAKVIGVEIFGACVDTGILSRATANAYKSGLKRALHWGQPWHARAHFAPEDGGLKPIPANERTGRGKAGAKAKSHRPTTAASLKVDAKKRTVALTVPKSVKPDQFGAAVLAVGSEPGRVALFLAWVKSHGWK